MRNLTVLAYHKVNNSDKNALSVSVENFEKQMEYLRVNGYHVISHEELLNKIKKSTEIDKKTVVITFDDGHKDNYGFAYPIFKKYGYTATIFLSISFIGKENFLSWDEIKIMRDSGIFFGAHTVNHPHLTQIENEQARKEIIESKLILEKELGKKCLSFCYPYGDTNDGIKDLVKECGFEMAFITPPKSGLKEDLLYIKRVGIYHHTDMLQFKFKIWGVYSFLKRR